mgnify:FL=1
MGNEIRERFRDRKYSYRKKRKKEKELQKESLSESPIKIVLFSPFILFGFIGKIVDNIRIKSEDKRILNENNKDKNLNNKKSEKQLENEIEKENNIIIKNNYITTKSKINPNNLEEKIFIKLQKQLIKLKNECEIVESEEYIINKYEKDNELYQKAKEINEKINKILKRLEKINKEYKIIKDNNLVVDPLYLDDSILIDDIIAYRNMIEEKQYKDINSRIKLLEEYRYLYKNVDKLVEKTEDIKEKSDRRVKELEERDEKYKKAKNKMVNLSEIESCCNLIIAKNNKYLEELTSKINKIDKGKYVEKKLKGMNGFLSSTLRYIGLLTLTPLRGIIPGIAARTVATRKLLNEMLKNMHYETKEKVIYSAINYTSEINNKLYDIDSISDNIDGAIDDIVKLKKEFQDYFSIYNLEEYENAYKKILLLENNILNNKEKINIMKEKLIKNKKINNDVLTKVRKLNQEIN